MKKNFKSFEEISKENKSNYTIEKGENKMIIKNFDFEKKEYCTPDYCLSIDDECNELVERILYSDSSYFCDAIWEIADNAVHIYDDELLEVVRTTNISEYVSRAISEFDLKPDGQDGWRYITKTIQAGECLYYEEQLNEHIETIVQNALISYLKDIQIVSEKDYNPDDINNFIESYIDDVNVDTNDTLDSIIEDFETELKENFDVEIEPKAEHNKKSA